MGEALKKIVEIAIVYAVGEVVEEVANAAIGFSKEKVNKTLGNRPTLENLYMENNYYLRSMMGLAPNEWKTLNNMANKTA